jgi:hypothetical protein
MRPYTADDARGFHGRDAEIDELIGRLRAGERELYVIGPSVPASHARGHTYVVLARATARPC